MKLCKMVKSSPLWPLQFKTVLGNEDNVVGQLDVIQVATCFWGELEIILVLQIEFLPEQK